MSSRIQELDEIVRAHELNAHPFYQAWRAGTLPVERLADYAAEWAPFIAALDQGWDRIGLAEYAAEEREHDELWTRFRDALGARAGAEMHRPQSRTLLAVGENAFASVPEALGALYSFEVQQPATAQSKLDGLREHYAGTVDEGAQAYFRRGDRRAGDARGADRPTHRRGVRQDAHGVRRLQRGGVGCTRRSLLPRRLIDGGRRSGSPGREGPARADGGRRRGLRGLLSQRRQ